MEASTCVSDKTVLNKWETMADVVKQGAQHITLKDDKQSLACFGTP